VGVKHPPIIVGIDTGGTFTDLIAFLGAEIRTHKVLSTPANPAIAVLRGLRELLDGELPQIVTYGSTVATNALLERRGARVVLVTTEGFEDVIEIGRQNRPRLYELEPQRPQPLVPRHMRVGITERIAYDGEVLAPVSGRRLQQALRAIQRLQPESIAVCFLHSYANPAHERRVGQALKRLVDVPCTLSHRLVEEYREYERLSTTVVNAYVLPLMGRHLRELQRGLRRTRLRVMQSNGGAISARQGTQEAVRTVLSGPAGGVIGAWRVARSLNIDKAITFDMGGTSTDVSLIDGAPCYRTEWEICELPIKIPALEIHTVGAGGGSLARLDAGGALKVGPESAGADPGPACYGKGTAATVTDANVLLGRLDAQGFLGGGMKLDRDRAQRAVVALAKQLRMSIERTAEGIIRVANASMERAIRRISVERGHDPREYTLIAFGGAAGQHACDLAGTLGIRRVIAPEHAGLLSAWGGAAADVQRDYVRTVRLANPPMRQLEQLFRPLDQVALRALRQEGLADRAATLRHLVDLRYRGQSYEIRLPLTRDYLEMFHREHHRLYGYADTDRPIEVVNLRLMAIGKGPNVPRSRVRHRSGAVARKQRIRWNRGWLTAPVLSRSNLPFGALVSGPAIITELSATTFVAPGWRALRHRTGHLEIVHED
jgi:N-methylhydantoinase A